MHYQIMSKAELIKEIHLQNCLNSFTECYPTLLEIINLENTDLYFGIENALNININVTSLSGWYY